MGKNSVCFTHLTFPLMKLKSLCLLLSLLMLGTLTGLQAQSKQVKQKQMTNYVNTSFKNFFQPVSPKDLQPQSYNAFESWIKKADINSSEKNSIRRLLSKVQNGKNQIKCLKIVGVTYLDTRKGGDAFILILPEKLQKLNGLDLDVIKMVESNKAEKEGDDDDDDDCRFEQGEDCFCANSDNCDCVSCTGCGCGGCGGCGSGGGGSSNDLMESAVWW